MNQTKKTDHDLILFGTPIWSERIDSGGMFDDVLAVYETTDGALPYLASCQTGFGGGMCARRATKEEAIAHAYRLHNKMHGYAED